MTESDAARAAANAEDNTIHQSRARMRKSHPFIRIGRTSAFPLHHGIGQFEVVLHPAVIAQQLDDFQNGFRRRGLTQFKCDLAGIKNFRK